MPDTQKGLNSYFSVVTTKNVSCWGIWVAQLVKHLNLKKKKFFFIFEKEKDRV